MIGLGDQRAEPFACCHIRAATHAMAAVHAVSTHPVAAVHSTASHAVATIDVVASHAVTAVHPVSSHGISVRRAAVAEPIAATATMSTVAIDGLRRSAANVACSRGRLSAAFAVAGPGHSTSAECSHAASIAVARSKPADAVRVATTAYAACAATTSMCTSTAAEWYSTTT